jgi:hypothetical protein
MLRRLCQIIAQTHAVSVDWVMDESKKVGIEKVIENLEFIDQNKPKY